MNFISNELGGRYGSSLYLLFIIHVYPLVYDYSIHETLFYKVPKLSLSINKTPFRYQTDNRIMSLVTTRTTLHHPSPSISGRHGSKNKYQYRVVYGFGTSEEVPDSMS